MEGGVGFIASILRLTLLLLNSPVLFVKMFEVQMSQIVSFKGKFHFHNNSLHYYRFNFYFMLHDIIAAYSVRQNGFGIFIGKLFSWDRSKVAHNDRRPTNG